MIVERIRQLCDERKISIAELERKLNLANSSIRKWEKGNPGIDKVEKVADYFNVSTDYLLGKTVYRKTINEEKLADDVQKYEVFQKLSNADVASSINFLLEQLGSENYGLMFDGEDMDDETRELLKSSLENSYRIAEMINKKKYKD